MRFELAMLGRWLVPRLVPAFPQLIRGTGPQVGRSAALLAAALAVSCKYHSHREAPPWKRPCASTPPSRSASCRSSRSRSRAAIAAASAGATGLGQCGASAQPPPSAASTRIRDRGDGHFEVEARIGARRIPFMVDTGATLVALTLGDRARPRPRLARRSDDCRDLHRQRLAQGQARSMLDRLDVDGVEVATMSRRWCCRRARLSTNLLGMSFLSRLNHFEIAAGHAGPGALTQARLRGRAGMACRHGPLEAAGEAV